ncbi:UvrD-helicase domain-containing protein [Urechidicola vernalis]|uniref:DNA 3'-5' helicase n=1 Tax=Urechidicola vernalis TaxID=3075600 RepID=A0ABU2Y1M6_9FLAO|nr:UvrD-helicase domain-containing protein [Urechidicola sp. P050]MDT0552113.1 UvrD-helicase domain-containing protein [Urechidicola sp. P050]
MINWIDKEKEYNPIREHIKLGFEIVDDSEKMAESIANELKEKNFNENKSRALIFVRSRNGTEEAVINLSKHLKNLKLPYADKVDFYHAGLDGTERTEKYESYKNGEIVILISTKAFGMGMDIKNIHFIFHLGPSSTFEDFLQEVGRAGRNEKSYVDAGYSKDNPLLSKCLMTNDDFNKIKDLQHSNEITWSNVESVRETVLKYIAQFRTLKKELENAFPLPLDLLEQYADYDEVRGKDTYFRVILYWLERLNRIKLGVFTPSQLPIKILNEDSSFQNIKTKHDKEQVKNLINLLLKIKRERFHESELIMADMQLLKDSLKIKTTTELFKLLFAAQKSKLIILDRNITLEQSINRSPELNKWRYEVSSPRIDATFEFADKILSSTKLGNQISLDNKELNEYLDEVIDQCFHPEFIFWTELKKNNSIISKEEITKKLIDDFKSTRAKFAFKLINFLPKIKHKAVIEYENEKAIVTQLLYNGNTSNSSTKEYLNSFKTDLIALTHCISKENEKNDTKTFNIVELINILGIENKGDQYFQQLIFISKGLGYLKGGGDLIPMGIELFISDLSQIGENLEIDPIVKKEFEESSKMKELRLLALKCLSNLNEDEHDAFIKEYFNCESLKDLIKLLIDHLSEDHPDVAAYREEALNDAKALLNEKQRKVYDGNLRRNHQVIAGPGTGKTHTLTLRVARLIQEEKINPDNILVLAYNRAVVVELKERLGKLFKKLGYSKLIKRLKVFTFHGFIKYSLGTEIDGLEFSEWTPKFIEIMTNSPGTISQKIGNIKYAFVDEFQDITNERMELLKFIANPKKTKVCVIGDPNQSIYGYERLNNGDPMDPQPYYDKFKEIYKPLEHNLNVNYRSHSEILSKSEELLSLNNTRFMMPQLEAAIPSIENMRYVEEFDFNEVQIDWKNKLQELLNYSDEVGRYKQIAIMFRSNNEVYRAFNLLKELNLNVRIRVQGSKGSLIRTREFYEILKYLENKNDVTLPSDYKEKISNIISQIIDRNPNWDQYLLDVFQCLVYEFEKEKDVDSKYEDLISFISDIGGKDDGQFGKIYQQNIHLINPDIIDQEIIITTMHKVKGLEFDAVLIPPSFSNLPTTTQFDPEVLQDYIEEERRLYYVAYSRAKRKLVTIKFDRENALENGVNYTVPTAMTNRLGISVNEGIDKFTMYWSASNYGGAAFNDLKNNVKVGDEIILRSVNQGPYIFWYAFINGRKIAQLSRSLIQKINHLNEVKGFVVSYIYVHTYEESLFSDDKNDTSFSDNWNQESKARGYTYLIDFSGYGK